MSGSGLLACVWALAGASLWAQPRVVNGKIETRPAGDFQRLAASSAPVWIGYEAAGRPRDHQMCDGNSRLVNPVKLEGSRELLILLRVEQGKAGKMRVYSSGCELDLGGLTLFWLTGMTPSASVRLLSSFLTGDRRLADSALLALSLQDDASAVAALFDTAKNHESPHVRGQALFWLAQAAGDKAVAAISGAIEDDPDTQVKKRAVFALYNLPRDEGVPKLIEVARANRNPEVRKQAMFWLGQSKDPRAVSFFETILISR